MPQHAPTSRAFLRMRLAPFDVIWAASAPFIALALRDPDLLSPEVVNANFWHPQQYALCAFGCAIPAFLIFRLSDGMSRYFSIHDVRAVAGATAFTVAASGVVDFMVNRLDGIPRSTPLIFGLVLGAGLIGGRTIARLSHAERPASANLEKSPHIRRVILIGVDRFAGTAIKLTDCQGARTTKIVSALDARGKFTGRSLNGVKIVGTTDDLEAVIEEYAVHGVEIDEVWLSDNHVSSADMASIDRQCRARGIRFAPLSEALNLTALRPPTLPVAPAEPEIGRFNSGYFRAKRAFDVVVTAVLLVLTLPLALIVAGVALYDVGAPVIFWQQRIGRGGRKFLLYKFRTYKAPFARNGQPVASEARLSKIGKALRATRFDEIPQLLNILCGHMSLIGPRPLLPRDQPSDPRARLLVRPGVSGWAQVCGGNLVTPEEKDALDIWYIRHASLALDLKIVIGTLKVVLRGERRCDAAIETAAKLCGKPQELHGRLFTGPWAAPDAFSALSKTSPVTNSHQAAGG